MYSIIVGALLFVAVNGAVLPGDLRSSMVMSERSGDSFAYTIEDHGGIVQHSQGMLMGKPLTYARAYPGHLGMVDTRSYPAMPSMVPLSGMSHLYGGVHPLARHGMAYASQPITYPGQPLLMGHQPLIADVTKQHVVIPQIKV